MALRMLIMLLFLSLTPAARAGSVVGEDRFHKVEPGDNLYTIARHFGLAIEHLAFANHLKVGLEVPVGRKLIIPLGDRWIGLSARGVGIHATTYPQSIGDDASHGCIRTYPELAHDLFTRVKVGMPVRIEYRTVRIGRHRESGKLFMAVFPDVYR